MSSSRKLSAQMMQPKAEPSDSPTPPSFVPSEEDSESEPRRPQRKTNKETKKGKKNKKTAKKPRAATMDFVAPQDGELEHIALVESDPPLAKFPNILRQQLEEYFAKPDASPGVLGTNNNTYSIHRAADTGKPMYFFEPDSGVRLDAALYRYGIGKKSVQMTIIQARAGSTFNNGEPSIIVYFGKKTAGKGRAHENGSRWALWTPNGLRRDLMVDRLRVTEDKDQDKKEVNADPNNKTDENAGDNADNATPDADASTYVGDDTEADANTNDAMTPVEQEPAARAFLKRSLSTSADLSPRNVRPRRSSIMPISTTAASNLYYVFTAGPEDTYPLVKSQEQCNSMGKIFAYAQVAGFCDSRVFVLSVFIDGNKIMDVVRDDGEDFAALQIHIASYRQAAGDDATIDVVIKPCLD